MACALQNCSLPPSSLGETVQEDPVTEADRSEGVRHSAEAQELSPQPQLVQPSLTSPALISQPAGTKRKRLQDPEDETEVEADEQQLPPSKFRLSEKNLQLFNGEMDSAANDSLSGSIKRSSSQLSLSQRSNVKSSSSTNHQYRFRVLAPAQIKIHADPPPKNIQDAIDAIVNAKPPEGRREKLEFISQEFQASCIKNVRTSVSEGYFVRILRDALVALGYDILCVDENADWLGQLKPKIQTYTNTVGSLRFMGGSRQQKVGDGSAPPPAKRQQQSAGQPYISPQASTVNEPQESGTVVPLGPPPVPETEKTIKTPRPDITIGILSSALTSALSSQGLSKVHAQLFIEELQSRMEIQNPGGLISFPSARAVDLLFPFAVDEGKAYLTGKQISEAENQAAGAGACALNMQLRLDDLVSRGTTEPSKDQSPKSSDNLPAPSEDQPPTLPPPSDDQVPLFFSICTEGPIHVLWVHWTEVEDETRQYNMRPLKCVYGVLPDGLLEFFVMVDNMLRWGTGHFLESLVVRLGKVQRTWRSEIE